MARLKKLADWLAGARILFRRLQPYGRNGGISPSIGWTCRLRSIVAWRPPISSRAHTPGFACEHARVCRWRDSGMVKHWASALLATEKELPQDHGLSGTLGLGSDALMDRSLSPDRRWRNKMAATAATNSERDSGHPLATTDPAQKWNTSGRPPNRVFSSYKAGVCNRFLAGPRRVCGSNAWK